jgi:hypothetical protein
MQKDQIISQLTSHTETIRSLAAGISPEQARWKPTPDQWSILEVLCHLHDEEVEDFRTHLDFILHPSGQPWSRIDPQGWVTQHQYNQRDLTQTLDAFLKERQISLQWLAGLIDPDWDAVYQSPFGPLTAGDMANSWVGHDLLHCRQLVELHWAHASRIADPYRLDYAGEW